MVKTGEVKPIHEWLHLDGATDLYDDPSENNNSVMGSASTNFNVDNQTEREICSNYLIIARKAHQLLIGDTNMGNWGLYLTPLIDLKSYQANPMQGGMVLYDSSPESSNKQQLEDLK